MHIAIAGNIGSGKTTLTRLLSKHFGWEAHYEDVETNPYLSNFYEDMQRWSFNLQVYFLNSRFRQIIKIRQSGKTVVQDRTILIYLRSSIPNLVNQIQKRGREYEESIRLDYLKRLNERYEAWVEKYDKGNLLIIDVDDIDMEEKPEDLGMIIDRVNAEIHGLF
jgi:deoxyadenosine/deoxycytidine kinase